MTVLDILKTASVYLNIDETLTPIWNEEENVSSDVQKIFSTLLTSFNEMVGYLFSTKFDMLDTREIVFDQNGEYDLSSLPFSIKNVKSLSCGGRSVKYEVCGSTLYSKKGITAKIKYSFLPEELSENDDFDFCIGVDMGTLAIGVAWFYSLNNSIFDDAESFKSQFVENINKMAKTRSHFTRQRRWE